MTVLYWILGLFIFDFIVITPMIKKYYRGYLPGEKASQRHERLGIDIEARREAARERRRLKVDLTAIPGTGLLLVPQNKNTNNFLLVTPNVSTNTTLLLDMIKEEV